MSTWGQAAHGGWFVTGLTAAYLAAAGLSLLAALIILLGKEKAGFRPEEAPDRG